MKFEKNSFNNLEKEKKEWLEDIWLYYKGETHSHSLHSNRLEEDGSKEKMVHSSRRLLSYAEKLGLEFVFFSEHSSDPDSPKKLSENHPICQSLLKQKQEVDEINESEKYETQAFQAVEVNIMFDENGEAVVDVPDSILSQIDLVIASRHKIDDKLEPEKIKDSLFSAINNPNIHVIGHPYRHIEFYQNDWNYFKKYYQNDEVIGSVLKKLEENQDWDKIKQIIGKIEAKDPKMKEYNLLFNELKKRYWDSWEEVLKKMEEKGKCFEINLSSFNPVKEYYISLLKKASKYKDLKYSITFDFHHLGQLENYKNKDFFSTTPEEIKNPSRAKGVQRILELIKLLKSLNIDPEKIINSSNDNIKKFISSFN